MNDTSLEAQEPRDADEEGAEYSQEYKDWLWNRRQYVVYRAELSTTYHRKRERFFALLDRCSKTLSLIAGTAAFSSFLVTPESKSVAGLVVALSTLPGLAFGWSDKARQHADLAQKFLTIEAEIVNAGMTDYEEKQLDAWQAKVMHVELSEPPTLGGLVALCHNRLALAKGDEELVVHLSWLQRAFCQIFDMQPNWRQSERVPGQDNQAA
jgi:hypothetical protein